MKVLHIVPGLDDPTCGIAVAAKMVARRQRASEKGVECVDFKAWTTRQIAAADEIWVHSMWTPGVMSAAWTALRLKKMLVRMPHGCMDPGKRRHHWWKKRGVTPIERWLFGKADRVVATCENEVEWIKEFQPSVKSVEMLSLSGGVDFSRVECKGRKDGELRLLYIGRLHPLKGVEFLLGAMNEISRRSKSKLKCESSYFLSSTSTKDFNFSIKLRVIGKDEGEGEKLRQLSKEFGLDVEFCGIVSEDEKERAWDWCDVLVLPTLSENFGLVVAEALERGKRVITTDGAPVWGDGNDYGGRLVYLKGFRDGSEAERVRLLRDALMMMV